MRDDLPGDWEVAGESDDGDAVVLHNTGDREALEVGDLHLLMASYGYRPWYVVRGSGRVAFRRG